MITTPLSSFIVAVEEATDAASNANWGQFVLILAAAAVLVWMIYLFVASQRGEEPGPEETPKNLQPYFSDDELENTHLTRVLGAAVIAAAVLAITLPVYYIGESRRQADAAEAFSEKDIHEGEKWFNELFVCSDCHGPDGGGGGAAFVEARSGLTTAWAAPSLNDVFFRYSDEEVAYWLNYGRSGTPMPVIGLPGGGAATLQEVDQLIAYLHSIQVSQAEALAKADSAVAQALNRIDLAEVAVSQLIRRQQGVVDDIADSTMRIAAIGDLADTIRTLLAGDGTCTAASAAAVGSSCASPGADQDRDGLTDEAELLLAGPDNQIASLIEATVLVRDVAASDELVTFDTEGNAIYTADLAPDSAYPHLYDLALSPLDAFTMSDPSGEALPDLESVDSFLADLDTATLNLSVTSDRIDVFTANAEAGYDFLVNAFETKAWTVDFEQVATATGLSLEDSERAVGLFNAYCARCHTAGYSAGVAYEQGAGSGAWGPALTDGRSVVQFPDHEDQVDFIIRGSNLAENYGVNGIGRGWMPGFGRVLTEEDIRLIVTYERSL